MLKQVHKIFITIVLGALYCLGNFVIYRLDSNDRVYILDVGQGDSILIKLDNTYVLVDGGPDWTVLHRLGQYMPFYKHDIDVLVLTHPHADHVNGLIEVMRRSDYQFVLHNYVQYSSWVYSEFLSSSKLINLGSSGAWSLPLGGGFYMWTGPLDMKNVNNDSVVILLQLQNSKVLLMGDAEQELEAYLLTQSSFQRLACNVSYLKVGHHCSKTASTEEFLDLVKPSLAVCSVGENNKFGHPHADALTRLHDVGAQVLMTDEQGTVVIRE